MSLTCDICGGRLTVSEDGAAVCDACGKEYSAQAVCEKQDALDAELPASSVKVSKDQTASYLNLCKLAENAGDYAKAESYAAKLLMAEPKNAEASFLKGKAASRQYTGSDSKLSEAVVSWVSAIGFCDTAEDKADMRKCIAKEFLSTVENAVTSLASEFEDAPSNAIKNSIYNTTIVDYFALRGRLASGASVEFGDLDEFDNKLAKKLYESAKEASSDADRDHGFGKVGMREEAYHKWLEKTDSCLKVFEYSMTLATDDTFVEEIYRDIKSLQESEIRACDEQFKTNGIESDRYWAELEKSYLQKVIADMTAKKDELIASIRQRQEAQRIAAEEDAERQQELAEYRLAHPELKTELEAALDSVLKEKADLEAKAEEIREKTDAFRQKDSEAMQMPEALIQIEKDLEAAKKEYKSLGRFACRKKKKLQKQIDELSKQKQEQLKQAILAQQDNRESLEAESAELEGKLKDYEGMIDDCHRLIVTIKEQLKNI